MLLVLYFCFSIPFFLRYKPKKKMHYKAVYAMFALAHFAVAAPAGAFNRFPTPAPPANMSPGSTSYPTDVGGRYNGGPTSNDQYGAPAGGFTSQMPPGNGPAGSTSYPADVGGRYNGGPTSNKPYDPYQAELDPKDPPRGKQSLFLFFYYYRRQRFMIFFL